MQVNQCQFCVLKPKTKSRPAFLPSYLPTNKPTNNLRTPQSHWGRLHAVAVPLQHSPYRGRNTQRIRYKNDLEATDNVRRADNKLPNSLKVLLGEGKIEMSPRGPTLHDFDIWLQARVRPIRPQFLSTPPAVDQTTRPIDQSEADAVHFKHWESQNGRHLHQLLLQAPTSLTRLQQNEKSPRFVRKVTKLKYVAPFKFSTSTNVPS